MKNQTDNHMEHEVEGTILRDIYIYVYTDICNGDFNGNSNGR